MVYSYIRISTDKQTVENQRFEIQSYATQNNIRINKWIEETISSKKLLADRKLGTLLQTIESQDTIIVSEISRLGRNLMQIMGILNLCMEKKIKIISIKENYELGDNINSKVLAFAFGLSAEIERNLISQRTKEALARKKAEGALLGRPKGSQSKKLKLQGKEQLIRKLLNDGYSKSDIAKKLGICYDTLNRFVFRKMPEEYKTFFSQDNPEQSSITGEAKREA